MEPERKRAPCWMWLALLALPCLLYLPSLTGALVYDDLLMIARNPAIRGLDRLPQSLLEPFWSFLQPSPLPAPGFWRPLVTLLLTIAYVLGDGEPLTFHLLSVLGHALATLAAFALALRLSGRRAVAFGTALLFATHPVQVESVAWISALNNPTSGLLSLLSLLAFLRWRQEGSQGLPWPALLFWCGALAAKETAAAQPLLMLALDLGRKKDPREPLLRPFLRGYLPFVIGIACYLLARVFVFAELSAGLWRSTTQFSGSPLRLAFLPVELLGGFLELLLWPLSLNLFRPLAPDPEAWTLGSATLLCLLLALATLTHRRRRPELAALLLIPASLLPLLASLTSVGPFPLAERHLYLGVFGFALFSCLWIQRLPKVPARVLLAVLVAALGARSFERLGFWKDQETLYRSAVVASPELPYVHWGLGQHLLQDYLSSKEPARLAEALLEYRRAEALLAPAAEGKVHATDEDRLQIQVGLAWCELCRVEGAGSPDVAAIRARFEKLVHEHPLSDEARGGLAVALLREGDPERAEQELEAALAIRPGQVQIRVNLARLHFMNGNLEDARRELERCLETDPRNLPAQLLLAELYREQRETERERAVLERALSFHPGSREVQARLSRCFLDRGRHHAESGRFDEAIRCFREASRLTPASFEARYDLGSLLLRNGRREEARIHLRAALELARKLPIGDPRRRSIGQLERLAR